MFKLTHLFLNPEEAHSCLNWAEANQQKGWLSSLHWAEAAAFVMHYPYEQPAPSLLLDIAAEAATAKTTRFLPALQLQHCSLQEK